LRRSTTWRCFSKEATCSGPDPTGLMLCSTPRASIAFFETMQPETSASAIAKERGARLIEHDAPGVLVDHLDALQVCPVALVGRFLAADRGDHERSKENFTSSAVISPNPSVNICPGLSRNSTTVGETCFTSSAASFSSSVVPGFWVISF
jgi:hypothetical protein